MKLKHKYIERDMSGSVRLVPEEPEDMWHAFNLIRPGDRLRAAAIRKVTTTSSTGSTTSQRVRTNLDLKIDKIDFDAQASQLHIAGTVIGENPYVTLGQHHTLDLEMNREFTLAKDEWNQVELDTIKESTNIASRAEIAAVVLQEGTANICLITEHMTVTKQHLEVSVPRKRRNGIDGHEKGLKRFYDQITTSILRHFELSKLKVILLASPGFLAESLRTHINEGARNSGNRELLDAMPKFLVVHSSSGHVHALNEILSSPAIQAKLADTKFAKETKAMQDFYEMMTKDEARAWYGPKEVAKAIEIGAVRTLLVSNAMFRSDDIAVRRHWAQMVATVKAGGGEALVLSSIHESGQRLDTLGGVAAVLTYPMEMEDEDQQVWEESDDER